MKAMKRGIATLLGALTTIGLLYLMSELINTEFIAPPESGSVKIPDIRMANTEIETRVEDPKPEKPVEQDVPPELPEPEFEAPKVSGDALNMTAPVAKAEIVIGGANLSFAEGEYLPIVKVPPEYPQSAASRGVEGECTVVYTVTTTGATRDPVPIPETCITTEGKPTTLFNRSSVRAALKFKYKPKVVDGTPVEVPGVKNRFVYKLAQ